MAFDSQSRRMGLVPLPGIKFSIRETKLNKYHLNS
jgi:hypothetical protein